MSLLSPPITSSSFSRLSAAAGAQDQHPQIEAAVRAMGEQIQALQHQQQELAAAAGLADTGEISRLWVLHGYIWVFAVAFIVTLISTPIMRRLALANGIIDRPNDPRKIHRMPVAYLGGVGVFLGLMGGVLFSYLGNTIDGLIRFHPSTHLIEGSMHAPMPVSIVLGMFLIMMVGLLDDVLKISPRIKVAGQLVAAAALAIDTVGVKVAQGVLGPIGSALFGNSDLVFVLHLPQDLPFLPPQVSIDLIYWSGTAIIALFVLGACNASNLIDGLDGLLSGTTAICSAGLLFIALSLAIADDGVRDSQRIVLCLALLGACMGFLPHNFNPATIFLGDCGSLLMGYCTIVIVLMLGDTGKTHLVFAGLIIYAIPVIDTVLAIVRRKMAGKSISDADDQHLHHMLKRALGVKGAVLALYAIGIGFAGLGVWLSLSKSRVVYAVALVFAAYIAVTAIKIARRRQIEDQAMRQAAGLPPAPRRGAPPSPPSSSPSGPAPTSRSA